MRAINVRQPYAALIVHGHKTVEMRTWSTRHRGWIAVVASAKVARVGDQHGDWTVAVSPQTGHLVLVQSGHPAIELVHGAVIGIVRVEDVTVLDGRMRGWILSHPIPIERPVPVSGQLGMYELHPAVTADVLAQAGAV